MFNKLPLILDGSTGHELIARGMPSGVSTEIWVLENPEKLIELQDEYIKNGSDIIFAPTFGANSPTMKRHGFEGSIKELNRSLLAISKKASLNRVKVGADISPTGLMILPFGETPIEDIIDIYKEQASALIDAGADFFAVETTINLAEARAALIAIRELCDLPVLVTVTCDKKGRTMSGNDIFACLLSLEAVGADAFGLNCSTGPSDMILPFSRISPYAKIPLAAKPNAGVPHVDEHGKTVFDLSPLEFAAYAKPLYEAGVRIFGGCCGTNPAHIAALKSELSKITFAEPQKADISNSFLLANEKEGFILQKNVYISEAFPCDGNLTEQLMDFEGDIFHLSINSKADIDAFFETSYMLSAPLALTVKNVSLLEKFANGYCGVFLLILCADKDNNKNVIKQIQKRYGFLIAEDLI